MRANFYQQQAFTLLEVLVVLIIFSLIATYALPNYSKFMLRSRVNTMYETANVAKFVVTNDYYNQNAFPNYANGATPFTTTKSIYIASISVTLGVIVVNGVAANLYGNAINLTLKPTADAQNQINWVCCVSSDTFFDFVPPACRNSIAACS